MVTGALASLVTRSSPRGYRPWAAHSCCRWPYLLTSSFRQLSGVGCSQHSVRIHNQQPALHHPCSTRLLLHPTSQHSTRIHTNTRLRHAICSFHASLRPLPQPSTSLPIPSTPSGLFTTQDVNEGEELIYIPSHLVLSVKNAPASVRTLRQRTWVCLGILRGSKAMAVDGSVRRSMDMVPCEPVGYKRGFVLPCPKHRALNRRRSMQRQNDGARCTPALTWWPCAAAAERKVWGAPGPDHRRTCARTSQVQGTTLDCHMLLCKAVAAVAQQRDTDC